MVKCRKPDRKVPLVRVIELKAGEKLKVVGKDGRRFVAFCPMVSFMTSSLSIEADK